MRSSENPVPFSNRAVMEPATFSVGAHVAERVVIVNIYRADGQTDVIEMTPLEARVLARYLVESANSMEVCS